MHPFALASANDPATAIAAHADDPELAFIAGGPDLIGLMKDRAAPPIEAVAAGGGRLPPPPGTGSIGSAAPASLRPRRGRPPPTEARPGGSAWGPAVPSGRC